MTLDEFMALDGKHRDMVVATKVMGWRFDDDGLFWAGTHHRIEDGTLIEIDMDIPRWSPTTSIADAWEVVEKLRPTSAFAIYNNPDSWDVYIEPRSGFGSGESSERSELPLAICIAALRAVGAITTP
jgi:hypothetical protein